jgi:hypothetical protein
MTSIATPHPSRIPQSGDAGPSRPTSTASTPETSSRARLLKKLRPWSLGHHQSDSDADEPSKPSHARSRTSGDAYAELRVWPDGVTMGRGSGGWGGSGREPGYHREGDNDSEVEIIADAYSWAEPNLVGTNRHRVTVSSTRELDSCLFCQPEFSATPSRAEPHGAISSLADSNFPGSPRRKVSLVTGFDCW